jgi:hypothetical protein
VAACAVCAPRSSATSSTALRSWSVMPISQHAVFDRGSRKFAMYTVCWRGLREFENSFPPLRTSDSRGLTMTHRRVRPVRDHLQTSETLREEELNFQLSKEAKSSSSEAIMKATIDSARNSAR